MTVNLIAEFLPFVFGLTHQLLPIAPLVLQFVNNEYGDS